MANQIHVVPNVRGGWDIKKDGGEKAFLHTTKKPEAEARARQLALQQKLELVIHKKDGSIAQKDSHGKDQYPPKG